MTNSETMKKIMQLYKFEMPISADTIHGMHNAKKTVLTYILKRYAHFGILTVLSVKMFLLLKKYGISVAISKVYLIIISTAIIVTCAAAATGTILIKRYLSATNPQTISIAQNKEKTEIKSVTVEMPGQINYKLEITKISSSPELTDLSKTVMQKLLRSLSLSKGNSFAVIDDGSNRTNTPYILTGSISQLGEIITLRIRVVDSSTSRVLVMASERIGDTKNISEPVETIAKKIAEKL